MPWLGERHGNPSSAHEYGRQASAAVEESREQVAYLIDAKPREITFCASGSEANNTVLAAYAGADDRVVVSSFEHPSILRAAESLERQGVDVERVDPQGDGRSSPEDWRRALEPATTLAALMLANNEVGSLQPVAEVAAAAHEAGAAILTDAVQAVGKVEVNVNALGVDYLVLGGHKFHGPLGAAAVWVRPGSRWRPLLVGGSQEAGLRASTVNVPAVVGLGVACTLAAEQLPERQRAMRRLRDRFEGAISDLDGVRVHAAEVERLPNTSSAAFDGVNAQALMIRLDMAGFAVSMGSACGSGKVEPSATMKAMRLSDKVAGETLRFSFAATNTEAEVDALASAVRSGVEALREPVGASA